MLSSSSGLWLTLLILEGVISSALLDRWILRVGLTDAIVDGGDVTPPPLFSEKEFTEMRMNNVRTEMQSTYIVMPEI